MGCERITIGGHAGIICDRTRTPRCAFCGRARSATLLCDAPVGSKKTCDAKVCPACALEVGPDRHHCPKHRGAGVQGGLFG